MHIVEHDVKWPGNYARTRGRWDELHEVVKKMKVDETIAVELDNARDCKTARDTVHAFTKKELDCLSAGWKLQTTIKDTTLYIRKILV